MTKYSFCMSYFHCLMHEGTHKTRLWTEGMLFISGWGSKHVFYKEQKRFIKASFHEVIYLSPIHHFSEY